MENRVLVWDGCNNVRDLGGLRTCAGVTTRWKAVVRSDSPARLTAAGWAALYGYGIRTIITLRTCVIRSMSASESGASRPPNPEHVVH